MPKTENGLVRTSENISVTIPSWLVEVTEEFCKRHDYTKSGLIRRALKHYIAARRQYDHDYWIQVYNEYFDK
ncbi:unnamed protein product [marine sediment metagenome]|uniref:Ribbon-helix-helix protein CopG domain-containing protein n=1 Tax=marine sediment metagenome TaxID=412755 RepID=X1ENA6_9ZZZZ